MAVRNLPAPTFVGETVTDGGIDFIAFPADGGELAWFLVDADRSPRGADSGVVGVPTGIQFNTSTRVLTLNRRNENDLTVNIPGGSGGGGGTAITFDIPAQMGDFTDSGLTFPNQLTLNEGSSVGGLVISGGNPQEIIVGDIDTGRVTVSGVNYTFGISADSGNTISISNFSGAATIPAGTAIFIGDGGSVAQTVNVTSIVNNEATSIDSDSGALTVAPEVLISRLRDGYTKVLSFGSDGNVTSIAYTATDQTSYTATFAYDDSSNLTTVTYTETDTSTTVITKTLTYDDAGNVTNVTLT